jgi:hypothetical protein
LTKKLQPARQMGLVERLPYSDHLHNVRWNNDTDQLETVTEFDFDRVDLDLAGEDEAAESSVSISDASSAILRCLYWFRAAHGNDDTPQSRLLAIAARAEALLWLLNPSEKPIRQFNRHRAGCGHYEGIDQ